MKNKDLFEIDKLLIIAFLFLSTLNVGCAGKYVTNSTEGPTSRNSLKKIEGVPDGKGSRSLRDHIVRANRDGLYIHADSTIDGGSNPAKSRPLPQAEVEAEIDHLIHEAVKLADYRKSETVRVLVFVHGGLNSLDDTDEKIKNGMVMKIMEDSEEWSYPIFISWPTGAYSTWSDHIFRIREGRIAKPWIGVVSSPFIVAADLLKSVGNYPATISYQISNEKDRVTSAGWLPSDWISYSWKQSYMNYCKHFGSGDSRCEKLCLGGSEAEQLRVKANYSQYYKDSGLRVAARAATDVISFPVRSTLGSLWHSGISSSAWDNMKRRASVVSQKFTELFILSDNRAIGAIMSSADLRHTKGFGSSLWMFRYR